MQRTLKKRLAFVINSSNPSSKMEKVYQGNVPDIFYYVWISSKNSLLHVHMNLGNVHVRVCGAAVTWFLNLFLKDFWVSTDCY